MRLNAPVTNLNENIAMFQLFLFVGSVIAFIIGGLIILIGIGVITGCAGGLVVMFAGGIIAFVGLCSVITYFLPAPGNMASRSQTINLIKHNGKWAKV
jgi:uncharacterized membrane protein